MGLDAFVHCRCVVDGLAKPAPSRFEFGADGLGSVDDLQAEALLEFDQWLKGGCEHDWMQLAQEHIGNWAMYRAFQAALDRLDDGDAFRALRRELPESNGGSTLPEDAELCLEELANFTDSEATWSVFVLVDVSTGNVIGRRTEVYDGLFMWSGSDKAEGGISAQGQFFLRRIVSGDRDRSILFEAAEFWQKRTRLPIRRRRWLLTDQEGRTTRVTNSISIQTQNGVQVPRHLRVLEQAENIASVDYVASALRRIFEASVSHDMPVIWS